MSSNREKAEASYRAWLQAARDAAGSAQALNSLISRNIGRRSRNIDAKIRGWTNPSSSKLPSSNDDGEIEALASAIQHFAPNAPQEDRLGLPIAELIQEVIRLRHDNQVHGVKLSASSEQLYKNEVLGMPVATLAELDLLKLNLGSALFEGGLPPYSSRDVDDEIIAALNDPEVNLVTVLGAPKVGKTRTLVECLRKSKLSQRNIYWVRPGSDISELIAALKPSDRNSSIVVIDDLQRWGHELQKLSLTALLELQSRSKVLITLHTSDFLKWKATQLEHGSSFRISTQIVPSFGPSAAVVEEIERSAFRLASVLSPTELAQATQASPSLPPAKLKNLGAYFSSLEYLLRTMEALAQSDDPFTEAMVGAIIDSRILYPNGVTIESLESLTDFELSSLSPHLFYSRAKFEILLSEVFTRGASTDSPHSILQRTPDNPKTFSLFESLWDGIKPKTWKAPKALISKTEALLLSENIATAGYPGEVIDVLSSFPELEDGPYCLQMASAYSDLDNEKEEVDWYTRGVSHGHAQSMFHYAYFLEDRDEDRAKELYLKASELGDVDSMFNLALMVRNDQPNMAIELYERASAQGLREAMNNLAQMIEAKDPARAVELYEKSSDLGNKLATYNLAISLAKTDPSKAIKLYSELADAGDRDSMNNLAVMIWDDEPERSEELLTKSASLGNSRAMFNLAKMLEDAEPDRSDDYLDQSANLNYAPAIYVQGLNLRDKGLREESISKFEQAAALGDSASMFELGLMLEDVDNARAIEFIMKAAELGEVKAMVNYAFLLEETDLEESLKLYNLAAGLDDPRAKANLARLIEENDPIEAERLYRESAESGDGYGCLMFGMHIFETDPESAKIHFEKAMSDEQPGAWYWLGCYWELKDVTQAIDCYQNAVELDEDDRAAYKLGQILESSDPENAKKYYEFAIEFGNEGAGAALEAFVAKSSNHQHQPFAKTARPRKQIAEKDSSTQTTIEIKPTKTPKKISKAK